MISESFVVKLGKGETYRNITAEIQRIVASRRVQDGYINVRVKHTTCAIIINEDELGFMRDLFYRLDIIAPRSQKEYTMGGLNYYQHDDLALRTQNIEAGAEERTNGHAHVRAAFFPKGHGVEILEGKLDLGKYEQILFVDFDDIGPRRERTISVSIIIDQEKKSAQPCDDSRGLLS